MPAKQEDYGYGDVDDVVAQVGSGKFLSFKKGDKGRVIQIRLTSKPKYIIQHWVTGVDGRSTTDRCGGEKCAYCGEGVEEKIKKTSQWGWIVIDREDGRAKIFQGPLSIARSIREISEAKDKKTGKPLWGNPLLYDFAITRTEDPGNYYKVVPIPTGKGKSLTKGELKAIKEANFDLAKEMEGGKESENIGNYGADEIDVPEDLGGETKSKKDDIPF